MPIEHIAPQEIELASKKIRGICPKISSDELVTQVARCLGCEKVSANIGSYIREALRFEGRRRFWRRTQHPDIVTAGGKMHQKCRSENASPVS